MSSIHGGIGASIASLAAQTSGKVQAVRPVARQNNQPNIGGLLNGSAGRPGGISSNTAMGIDRNAPTPIGAKAGVFGALTLGGSAVDNTRVAAIGKEYKNAPQSGITQIGASYNASNPQPSKGSTQIGQLLAGGFGSMTTQGRQAQPQVAQIQPQAAQNGLMTNPNVQGNNFDAARHNEKNEDKKLSEALGMDSLSIMASAA